MIKRFKDFNLEYLLESVLEVSPEFKKIISGIKTSSGLERYIIDWVDNRSDIKTNYNLLGPGDSSDKILYLQDRQYQRFKETGVDVSTRTKIDSNVGRLVRSILNDNGIKFTEPQVEEFVNAYKAAWNKIYNPTDDLSVNSEGLTDEQRKFLDKNTRGIDKNTRGRWSVNSEGLVDVGGSFNCYRQGLEDFLGIRFGKVSGGFCCSGNQLETLEGAPREVGGYFWCDDNQLRTLEGAPRKVGRDFYCDENPLISLEGAPEVIEGEFWFKNTQSSYNLQSFLEFLDKIGHDKLDEISLLLTHHFFTPQVIKEQIEQNPDFPYYVSLVWNTEEFKKTQEELKKILPENILVKIDDLWSIGGYL